MDPVFTPGNIPESAIRERLATTAHPHPRLLVDAAGFTAAKASAQTPGAAADLVAAFRRDADALLAVPPVTRELQGRRLLDQSRRGVRRILTLAAVYRITGRQEYLARCRAEMLAAAAFSDWNPGHFLDVAEMTFALAVGYDWLYNELDTDSRARIRDAIVTHGLRTSLAREHAGWWVRSTNNWGQVCHGGLVAGALAVADDEPDLAVAIVHRAVNEVRFSLDAYAPHGAYPEGPGYWSYGTTYNVLLVAMLEDVLGSDFGLTAMPGFSETGGYLAQVTGPSGRTFNYADGGDGREYEPAVDWLASRWQRPDWALAQPELLKKDVARLGTTKDAAGGGHRLLPLAIFWHRPPAPGTACALPLHWSGGGHVPVTVHRSSWTAPEAVFVGVKAGAAKANHGHMDAGSFVLDADGVRWALDLGAQDYHSIESRGMNLWDSRQGSDRWKVFRINSLSHNTLVIDGQLHRADAKARIVCFSDAPAFPHTVVDMSPVYAGQATRVVRGVALLPSGEVLVQDALAGLRPGAVVRWGMVTRAVPVAGSAEPVRLLEQDKKQLQLRRLAPADTAWREYETAKPPAEWDAANPGTRMVGFEATAGADGTLRFAVLLTPGSCRASLASRLRLETAPADWSEQKPPLGG